ncbi:hemerythrin domain-containing protein [Pseudoalteromonas xiamenensis]|uniref:hemerythrin domain-containing protein n=1 Tax=Pseudoalteromonas xiamenensis TaxID=882626 RepID=UPI0035EA3F55
MNIAQSTVSELVAAIPGASELFDVYQIDYNLTPTLTLKDLVGESKNRLSEITNRLNTLINESELNMPSPWMNASTPTLIAHIVEHYHDKHKEQFPELIRLCHKVQLFHHEHPNFPAHLEAHFSKMYFELEEHMAKEEQILFPLMLDGLFPFGPISVMEEEHVDHAHALKELCELTNNFTPPDDACQTWTELYTKAKILHQDLNEHIHLENNILFKRNR